MRKLFAILAASLATIAVAAPLAAQTVSLGIKGGLNFANLTGENADTPDMYIRAIGGGFATIQWGIFGLQPEILYSQKGTNFTEAGPVIKFRADYLEVPVLVRIDPRAPEATFRPIAFAGPSIAFKLACNIEGPDGANSVESDCDDPVFEADIKNVDIGAVLGLGADVTLGKIVVVIDGRYTLSFDRIDDDGIDSDIKNSVFSALVGVRFPLWGPVLSLSR